jgi:hypothetical protein
MEKGRVTVISKEKKPYKRKRLVKKSTKALSDSDTEAKIDRKQPESQNIPSIFSQLLNQKVDETPILAFRKEIEKKLEDEKIERKAKRQLLQEKRALREKDHKLPAVETMNYEKKLRKVATKGVVQLFNAIKAQQASKSEKFTSKVDKQIEEQDAKSKFMEMIKSSSENLLTEFQ